MMLAGLLVLLVTNPGIVLNEMISASSSALSLCIELCAIYVIWLGIMQIVEDSGLSEKLSKLLRPLIRKIFKIKDEETEKIIALNLSANMLGLGNAATPMGIKAMQKLDDGSGKANFAMIMLIVINATSIQLLPTTVIGMRTAAGSTSASDIIVPTLLVTFITTLLGIVICHFIESLKGRKRRWVITFCLQFLFW